MQRALTPPLPLPLPCPGLEAIVGSRLPPPPPPGTAAAAAGGGSLLATLAARATVLERDMDAHVETRLVPTMAMGRARAESAAVATVERYGNKPAKGPSSIMSPVIAIACPLPPKAACGVARLAAVFSCTNSPNAPTSSRGTRDIQTVRLSTSQRALRSSDGAKRTRTKLARACLRRVRTRAVWLYIKESARGACFDTARSAGPRARPRAQAAERPVESGRGHVLLDLQGDDAPQRRV